MFSITPYAPIIEFLPAPTSLNAGWILPAAGLAFLIIRHRGAGLADRRARAAPVQISVRTSTGRALQLHRATRATAWLFLALRRRLGAGADGGQQ